MGRPAGSGWGMQNGREAASDINPLIGSDIADTIENLSVCLVSAGACLAARHDDPAIQLFCDCVAAALLYEAAQLRAQAA